MLLDFKNCIHCKEYKALDDFTILSWNGDGGFIRECICDSCKRKINVRDNDSFIGKKDGGKSKKYNLTEKNIIIFLVYRRVIVKFVKNINQNLKRNFLWIIVIKQEQYEDYYVVIVIQHQDCLKMTKRL